MILFVGTADQYLIDQATKHSKEAILITEENCDDFFEVGYTGYEEFNDKAKLLALFERADQIIYAPSPGVRTDIEIASRFALELLLLKAKQVNRNITSTNQFLLPDSDLTVSKNFLKLADVRRTLEPQLWSAGCSFTYGLGVSKKEKYPALLAKGLNLQLSCLAEPGSSIPWAADQILRSDIRKDDIVVWGLTAKDRLNWWIDDTFSNLTIGMYNVFNNLDGRVPKKLLLDTDNLCYQQLTHIHQVVNFCRKMEAKLLIVGLLVTDEDLLVLQSIPEYYHYYNSNLSGQIDVGSDDSHPGPLQHQDYATKILQQLKLRNII